MRIWLKPDRMAQLKLTPSQVAEAIRRQNAQFAAGKVGAEPTRSPVEFTYTVTTQGRLQSTEEFGTSSCAPPGWLQGAGEGHRPRRAGARDYSFSATRNGQPTIPIGIYLAPGANAAGHRPGGARQDGGAEKRFPAGLGTRSPVTTPRALWKSRSTRWSRPWARPWCWCSWWCICSCKTGAPR